MAGGIRRGVQAPDAEPDRLRPSEWEPSGTEVATTSGLVAYVDAEPAGWCSVEPRANFPYLPRTRLD